MVALSEYPIAVDGVRLDSLAFGVTEVRPAVANLRRADVLIPGADGVQPSLWDESEEALYGLTLWVRGTDADGFRAAGRDAESVMQDNLDTVLHLLRGTTHRLLDVRRVVDELGTERQALAKIDAVTVETGLGHEAEVSVAFAIPDGAWRDPATRDWVGNALNGVTQASGGTWNAAVQWDRNESWPGHFGFAEEATEIDSLRGSSAPVHDTVYLIRGPITSPELTDPATGAYLRLDRVLLADELWRVNSATWASRVGAGLLLASTDTDGADASAQTVYGGGSSRYLSLVATRTAADPVRRVRLVLNGRGLGPGTAVSVRTRRRFLL